MDSSSLLTTHQQRQQEQSFLQKFMIAAISGSGILHGFVIGLVYFKPTTTIAPPPLEATDEVEIVLENFALTPDAVTESAIDSIRSSASGGDESLRVATLTSTHTEVTPPQQTADFSAIISETDFNESLEPLEPWDTLSDADLFESPRPQPTPKPRPSPRPEPQSSPIPDRQNLTTSRVPLKPLEEVSKLPNQSITPPLETTLANSDNDAPIKPIGKINPAATPIETSEAGDNPDNATTERGLATETGKGFETGDRDNGTGGNSRTGNNPINNNGNHQTSTQNVAASSPNPNSLSPSQVAINPVPKTIETIQPTSKAVPNPPNNYGYERQAGERLATGTKARFRVEYDENGRVKGGRLVSSTGDPELDAAQLRDFNRALENNKKLRQQLEKRDPSKRDRPIRFTFDGQGETAAERKQITQNQQLMAELESKRQAEQAAAKQTVENPTVSTGAGSIRVPPPPEPVEASPEPVEASPPEPAEAPPEPVEASPPEPAEAPPEPVEASPPEPVEAPPPEPVEASPIGIGE